MKLPKLSELKTSRDMVDVFRGYNHNLRINEGEFYDMNNLTSDHYPVLSTREEHGTYRVARSEIKAMLDKDSICYIEGNVVHLGDNKTVEIPNMGNVKQMVSMGAYIIILNDAGKLYYVNTKSLDDYGFVSYTYSSTEFGDSANLTYYCVTDESGKIPYDSRPEDPKEGDLYSNSQEHILEKYVGGGTWTTVPIHTTIIATGIAQHFRVGDYVCFSGITSGANSYDKLNEGDHIITAIGTTQDGRDCITVRFEPTGTMIMQYTAQEVRVKREAPLFDYICSSNNRLWGCRYGYQKVLPEMTASVFVNEIYASSLGNFKRFGSYSTAADAYSVGLGSDGVFTGASVHQGSPVFFKEGTIHKVIGTLPDNYQMQTTECQGVKDGSYRSIATIDNVLFYHAPTGIYAYDGSYPRAVSHSFGIKPKFSNAVGGAYQRKYYVNMRPVAGTQESYATFVYDLDQDVWHKQDASWKVDAFAAAEDNLYFAYRETIYKMFGVGESDKGAVVWSAETGIIGADSPDKKYLSRLTFRLFVDTPSKLLIFLEYDSSTEWEHVATVPGQKLSSFSIPINVKRCDHFRIRFSGSGPCRIYSITKTMERGSEL